MHQIPGFDGYYLDDSLRVISRHGRPLAVFCDKDGYPRVSMAIERGQDARRLHRGLHQIVCLVYHGPCPKGQQVRHLDGNVKNYHPDNLCYSTVLVNNRDRFAHGTVPRGSKHGMAKLTEDKVRDIRALAAVKHARKSAFSDCQIALRFGVNVSTIRLIRLNKVWRHVYAAA